MSKRERKVLIRLTEKEKAILDKMANDESTPLASLCRQIVMREANKRIAETI